MVNSMQQRYHDLPSLLNFDLLIIMRVYYSPRLQYNNTSFFNVEIRVDILIYNIRILTIKSTGKYSVLVPISVTVK